MSTFSKKEPSVRINHMIKAREVRVLNDENEMVGVLTLSEALKLAEEQELDLIEIAPAAQPPVCKIMDYGKYKYEQDKKKKQQKAQTKKVDIKNIRLSLKIGEHDVEVKARAAHKILLAGHKIRIELGLYGREKQHVEMVQPIFKNFIEKIELMGQQEGGEKLAIAIEQPFERQGFRFSMLIRSK